jgi:hypothetical protein
MKTFVGIIFILSAFFLLYITGNNFLKSLGKQQQEAQEYGYFEGQKDALQNEFHIKQINDSIFVWVDSPWKDKREIIYFPQPNNK